MAFASTAHHARTTAGVAHLETAVIYVVVGAALLAVALSSPPRRLREAVGDLRSSAVGRGIEAFAVVATILLCRLFALLLLRGIDPGRGVWFNAAAAAFWFDLALFGLGLFGVCQVLEVAPRRGWIAIWALLAALATGVFVIAPLTLQPALRGDVPAPPGAGAQFLDFVRHDGVQAPSLFVFKGADPTAVDVERAGPFVRLAVSRAALEHPTPETYAALGHLLGHVTHHDLWGFVALVSLLGGLLLSGLALLQRRMRSGLSRGGRRPSLLPAATAVAIWAFVPFGAATFNLFDRTINLAADAHAVAITGDREALSRWLIKDSPGADPDPSFLDRVFFYDHPPLNFRLQRVFALKQSARFNETFASTR